MKVVYNTPIEDEKGQMEWAWMYRLGDASAQVSTTITLPDRWWEYATTRD